MKKRYKILLVFFLILIGLVVYFRMRVSITPPPIANTSVLEKKCIKVSDSLFVIDQTNFLKQNKYGLWELFVSGSPFEMGVKNGRLTKELSEYQEDAFVESLKSMIPSSFYLNFLKYFIAWFNRDIADYIPKEYQKEIYGISFSSSEKFNFIAPPYQRILNYHAAHDIGHMVQNLNLVACTAFGVNYDKSADSSLLIGRNMDFFVSDRFAEHKIVAFFKPQHGYPFAFITWAGMIGVISGMNQQGLTITLNSAKSDIPTSAKTPVSILARKILQYASTIDEAFAIAKANETFVSEAFLVSSANDNKFAIIEKSLDTTVLFYPPNDDEIILTNHFQSKSLGNRKLTVQNKQETETVYRWNRVKQLLDKTPQHTVSSFVDILRNRYGLNNKNIGMGNEMAINQLIAHHSIVLKPKQRQLWISVGPYTLGKYICYDLNRIFSDSLDFKKPLSIDSLSVAPDSFLFSKSYQHFVDYKRLTAEFERFLKDKSPTPLSKTVVARYETLNPQFYVPYFILGQYYQKMGDNATAISYYKKSLSMDIPKKIERDRIKKHLTQCSND